MQRVILSHVHFLCKQRLVSLLYPSKKSEPGPKTKEKRHKSWTDGSKSISKKKVTILNDKSEQSDRNCTRQSQETYNDDDEIKKERDIISEPKKSTPEERGKRKKNMN